MVIGGGMASLCAAITARRAGATVLLIEQAPYHLRGGNARHARNFRFAHNTPTPFTPATYSAAEFFADLKAASGGALNTALTDWFVHRSATVPEWLIGAGVSLQSPADGSLPFSRKTAFFLGGGMAAVNALYAQAARLGVTIAYGCAARALDWTAPGLLQVLLAQEGREYWLSPRAVVLGCGSAQASSTWRQVCGGGELINRGTPYNDGALLAALWARGVAASGDPCGAHWVAVDARSPADDGGIVTRIEGIPLGLVVDRTARRFADEGADTAGTRYARWGERLLRCPERSAYLILDQRGLHEAPAALYPPLLAPTLAELAAVLGLDRDRLTATVTAFNAAARPPSQGDDPAAWQAPTACPPKSRYARPLDVPPYGAYPLRPGLTFTYQGIAVDERMRVCLNDGRVLPQVYAAGVLALPNLLTRGYVSGLALTVSIVFGRRAGAQAAAWARFAR